MLKHHKKDDIFYLGSDEAVVTRKGNRSETVSPDSTYFSSIVSDTSEHQGNDDTTIAKSSVEMKSTPIIKHYTMPSRKDPYLRSHSDSVFGATDRSISCNHLTSSKYRLASETTAPILKAAELHQNLLQLRLSMNSLYTERFQLKKELDGTLMRRENLLAKHQDLQNVPSSTPLDARRLLELRESLVRESEKTARLLDAATQAKYSVLDPGSLEAIKVLSMKHTKERQRIIDRRLEALEDQIDLLNQHEDKTDESPLEAEHLQQSLLESKNRLCTFLRAEISRILALLEEKTGIKQPGVKVSFASEADLKIRLKILRFGLDERRKKLQNCENTAATLAAKLSSMEQEANEKRVSLLADLVTLVESQRERYREFRQQVESMRRELDETKVNSEETTEMTIAERNQKLEALESEICAVRAEIRQLDAQPVLACQQLEAAQKEMESAISEAGQNCYQIKLKIRKRYKTLKDLRPMEAEVSARLQKLDDLNHRFSVLSKRLEKAENLDRKTQEVLARQELRVEDAKLKFSRVKELYDEEKRVQSERVRELEMEKEEYVEKLMCLNRKLDRLGRQHLLKGAQSAYKWLMASFDVQEPEEEEEIDEYAGKRCAFFCQEIKRLQQHTAWLEGTLEAVQSKSLSRQRINAIKAVLDRGGSQMTSTDVRRRNFTRSTRPRPISLIEIGTKSTVHRITPSSLTTSNHVDSRRRRMNFVNPAPSQEAPTVSATKRRLAYSQSLRERRNTNRTPLASHSFQHGTPTSASLSFRTSTPLIYTAFRSTKCTASRTFDCTD
ncbi:hypothetical protein TcWFU_010169 [Taenia crassiceps]|uniref:Uncharacterized protein n=1 Tax=Taenia crassiceps TaxID=6207 RepID=A0ABR4QKG7_9CEST